MVRWLGDSPWDPTIHGSAVQVSGLIISGKSSPTCWALVPNGPARAVGLALVIYERRRRIISFSVLALRLLDGTAMPTDSRRHRRERDRKGTSAAGPGLLFIVSRDALDYYEHLKTAFADNRRVAVILDCRSAERRKTPSTRRPERRHADRRSRPLIDDRLRRQGWAIVRLELSR